MLVAGEAGIGKTSLVRVCCAGARDVRILSGACDQLAKSGTGTVTIAATVAYPGTTTTTDLTRQIQITK